MRPTLLTFFLLISFSLFAGKIAGTVRDEKGQVLSFASVTVKGTTIGAVANALGNYEISIETGTYTLICQHVGYKGESRTVKVEAEATADFQLELQQLTMEEVVIKQGADPAIAIIQQAIRKREFHRKQVDSMTVDVYIKGLLKSRVIPKKFVSKDADKEDMKKSGFDSLGRGILFLSESQTKVSYKRPNTYRYEVVSSRASGGGYGIALPFFIDMYTNNVEVFTSLNPRGFVSPISDNAFHYYKFHYEGSFFENDKMINRIKVTPRRQNEPLFTGYIQIVDGEWRIHSFDLYTTKNYELQLLDTVRLTQIHAPVSPTIWKTQNQVVYVAANTFGFEWTGNFLNVYTNYNLDPGFKKKYFGRTVMTYDSSYNKKDSSFWANARPVALEPDEQKDFVFKDSLYKSFRDSVTNEFDDASSWGRSNVTVRSVVLTGPTSQRNGRKGNLSYRLTPLIYAIQFNTVEGLTPNFTNSYVWSKRGARNLLSADLNLRYGFSNQHFNSYLALNWKPKQNYLNRSFTIAGGRRVSQFNKANPIDPFVNTTYTLYRKRNYMKIYENWFGEIAAKGSFENGVRWRLTGLWEDRRPLENTTDYSFNKRSRVITPNHPQELANIPFNPHQAFIVSGGVSFQPGQHFIEFPFGKVAVGSKYPVFSLDYTKGIKSIAGSDVDFDKWKFSISDALDLKLRGELRFLIYAGGFLNRKQVEIPDLMHFTGNQTLAAQEYLNSFQLAPYYRYSNSERIYGVAHIEHHFNGLLTNKLPLFNKTKWTLVVGTNTFYVNRDNYYAEGFVGLENIFKIFRVDFIGGYGAAPGNNFGVRIGLGGILGDGLRKSLPAKK